MGFIHLRVNCSRHRKHIKQKREQISVVFFILEFILDEVGEVLFAGKKI